VKKPEEIPQAMIDKVRAAATGGPGFPDEMSDGVIVTMLAAVWDDIWAYGFTDGFSTKIEAEQ